MKQAQQHIDKVGIKTILKKGTEKIAPLWSLENFVAVNPYLGMAGKSFEEAMGFLSNSGNVKATLPQSFYIKALDKGTITKKDLAQALKQNKVGLAEDVEEFLAGLFKSSDQVDEEYSFQTLAQVASKLHEKEWERFMIDRISFWASAYFDKNQAIWKTTPQQSELYQSWKKEAEVDYSAEVMGLKNFRKIVAQYPDDHVEAAALAMERLQVPEKLQELYLTTLLMKMNGWAGIAARIDWDAGIAGVESQAAEEFLTVMLIWEVAIKEALNSVKLIHAWNNHLVDAKSKYGKFSIHLAQLLVLQKAFDIANQRTLIGKINAQPPVIENQTKSKVQAIFCIDVRSELYRRNLEAANNEIATMGFAGFFAFPINYVSLAHDTGTNQCPVLLPTSHTVEEHLHDHEKHEKAVEKRKLSHQLSKTWKSFKLGAITCFSFVGPVGLAYLPKLFTDTFGLTRPNPHPDEVALSKKEIAAKAVRLDGEGTGIPLKERVEMAANALKAMSLTENFAPIVMIAGHGSSTVNNPHATGLDCGACGGHTGEANAKVAAAVLNDWQVRHALKEKGIYIPESTLFVAALHDTTTDVVKLFKPENGWPISHQEAIQELEFSLALAGETSRKERATRMGIKESNAAKKVLQRSKDWSQVRPEWGLAGCSSFVVAPRERTQHLNLEGKTFMHSYDWQKDAGFGVLDLIMTAPMVVTSWINLQYYASTVDNEKFGSGNKTLHNVVAGLGVLEGFGGDLRTGLAWQSVHDGNEFQHEPQRLNVFIEAPVDEMSKILEKHESVKNLCDNEWIYLFAINEEGKVAYRYIGDLHWEMV